ncbi:MAG: hypothetical protein JRJ59_11320 [Deltaproteobacteria bacterium]|nr:hypothetical protein [Deltaproteobacteria bacterium]
MRYFGVGLLAVMCLAVFSTAAVAQESYYIRQNGAKYQQYLSLGGTCDNNIRSLQASLNAQRTAFNQGLASRDRNVRSRAKRTFLSYLDRLMRAYQDSWNAYNQAIYWGERYAAGLLQLQSRAAQGRQVAAQVRGLKNTLRSLRTTEGQLQQEARAASRR